jgi:DNA-binding SARP family transcriptional activator
LPPVSEEAETPIVPAPHDEFAPITPLSTQAAEAELEPALPPISAAPETPAVSGLPATAQHAPESYTMAIYCFGPFRVYQRHHLIEEWNGLRGQAVLKYLVARRGTPIAKDVLMDVFWPDADAEAARRNLHQAIYSLRQTLRRRAPDFQYIQFENNQYMLNPTLSVWIDVEEFQAHFQSGQRLEAAGQLAAAMTDYGTAEGLYQGDFLEEDPYDDWSRPQRERLRTTYLYIADRLSEYYRQQGEYSAAIALCQKILTLDNCVEEAHRRLMRCYLAQGQRHLAIRQYHTCVRALAKELDVPPDDETRKLYASISANS